MGRDTGDAIEKVRSKMRQVALGKVTRRENLDNVGWLKRKENKDLNTVYYTTIKLPYVYLILIATYNEYLPDLSLGWEH